MPRAGQIRALAEARLENAARRGILDKQNILRTI